MKNVDITISGRSGSGKSVIAKEISLYLKSKGMEVTLMDGDTDPVMPLDFPPPFEDKYFTPCCHVKIKTHLP